MSDQSQEDQTDPNIVLPEDPPTQEIPLDSAPKPPPLPRLGRELPRGSRPPPAPLIKKGSVPPQRMPTPSDRPMAPRSRPPTRPPERQRFAQMQTQLDQARSTLSRQKNELDELRTRLEAKEARLDEMIAELAGTPNIGERLAALDERGETLAEELRARLEAGGDAERLEDMDARVRELEEGSEMSRIRMRLERVGHTLRETLAHLANLEENQRELQARIAASEKNDARIERLESLFEELAEELKEKRELDDLHELRSRMDDFEARVVEAGEGERTLRAKLEKQTRRIQELGESIIPPGPTDDLTRVKGIGPKFARQLSDIGITTFAAIADWDEDDIANVAERLGIKPGRITRAGWVASATALMAG